jgi:hypothetical protein
MRKNIAIVYVIYLAISAVIYTASFDNLFRDEDFAHLLNSSRKASLLEVIKPTSLFASERPGALSLFYLEYQLFRLNSAMYLLFNYLLHVLVSLLAWRIFLDLGIGRMAAAIGASLFVLGYGHYGKQLMWANNGGPIMAVLITLLTIWATIRWLRISTEKKGARNRRIPNLYPIAVLALLFIGPTIHELTLFTPFFLIVIICSYPGRASQRIIRILPLFGPWPVWLLFLSRPDTVHHVISEGVARTGPYLLLYFGFFLAPIQQSGIVNDASLLGLVAGAATPIRFSAGLVFLATMAVVFWKAGGRPGNPLRIMVIWLVVATFPFCFVKLPEGYLELRHLYYASIPYCALVGCALSYLIGAAKLRVNAIAAILLVLISIATGTLASKLERKYDAESRSAANMEKIKQLRATIGE